MALGEVLLMGDAGSAIQTLVDPRGERMMAEKSSECSHQSSGARENAVQKFESSAKTYDCVLPERFGCQVNSEGIHGGLSDAWRTYSVSPRSVTMITTCVFS